MRALLIAAISACSAMAVAAAAEAAAFDQEGSFRHIRRRRPTTKRGKGLQAKPRKRPNMRHVSRRVRRMHRRAA